METFSFQENLVDEYFNQVNIKFKRYEAFLGSKDWFAGGEQVLFKIMIIILIIDSIHVTVFFVLVLHIKMYFILYY